jgi:hypothetical protein
VAVPGVPVSSSILIVCQWFECSRRIAEPQTSRKVEQKNVEDFRISLRWVMGIHCAALRAVFARCSIAYWGDFQKVRGFDANVRRLGEGGGRESESRLPVQPSRHRQRGGELCILHQRRRVGGGLRE